MSNSNRWLAQHLPLPMLLVLLASGCAPQRVIEGAQTAAPEPARMRVVNNHSLDMNVYIVLGPSWYRLGTVNSFGTASFGLRPAMIGTASFQIGLDPIGSVSRHVLDVTSIAPGEKLELMVQNRIQNSYWRMMNEFPGSAR